MQRGLLIWIKLFARNTQQWNIIYIHVRRTRIAISRTAVRFTVYAISNWLLFALFRVDVFHFRTKSKASQTAPSAFFMSTLNSEKSIFEVCNRKYENISFIFLTQDDTAQVTDPILQIFSHQKAHDVSLQRTSPIDRLIADSQWVAHFSLSRENRNASKSIIFRCSVWLRTQRTTSASHGTDVPTYNGYISFNAQVAASQEANHLAFIHRVLASTPTFSSQRHQWIQ